ncbi:hypothetical protein V499_00140 [Pseudogymnoascus sp. VKM F-103]|nr:hypothetical protein V499_00140 [Pseudogymnoascus sp. VKM F-103]
MEHLPTLKASKYALISVSKNGFFLVHVQYYTPLSFQMVYPLGCDMQHPCLAISHNPESGYSWLRFKNLRRISMRPLLLMAFGSEPGHHIFLAKCNHLANLLLYQLDLVGYSLLYTDVTDPPTGAVGGAMSPSLSYLNQPLENCEVSLVQIEVSSADRTAWQFATTPWGSASRVFITCGVFGPNGFTSLNLTVEYDLLPTSMAGFNQGTFKFLQSDKQNGAALWWGESLL